MGGLSIWHWLVVLLIVALIFGTKKLRDIGEDLGKAVRGFKEGLKDEGEKKSASENEAASANCKIEAKVDLTDKTEKAE